MPTKELLVDIGNYLEENYNMGGALKKVGEGADYLNQRVSGGDSKHYENMGAAGDDSAHQASEYIQRGPGEENAIKASFDILDHWIDETTNFLHKDPRGQNRAQEQKRAHEEQMQDLQDKLNAASQTYGQDKAKKKKKKGLLAMNTPSAKASRFRSGKRRFRVRPGNATGVNVGGASGSASVGTS